MSKTPKSDWTPKLVLKHLLSLRKADKDAVSAALAAAEKAVSVAENNSQLWRQGANEWRSAMTDRERNFATQADFQALKERIDRSEGGGAGMKALWGWAVAALMAAVALYNAFSSYPR